MEHKTSWPTPPLMAGPWHELDAGLTAELRDLLVGHQSRCRALVEAGRMLAFRVRPLPFWPEWMWIDALVEPGEGARVTASFLYGPYGPVPLEGHSMPIHEINDSGILNVGTAELACTYLRFFCCAVRGDEGPFHLVESAADFINLTGIEPAPEEVAAGARAVAAEQAEGGWQIEGTVYYGPALFVSRFRLSADGAVEMIDDEPVADELPRVPIEFDGLISRAKAPGAAA